MDIWKELKKQWRYMDGIVIVSLVLLSFIPYVVFGMTHQKSDQEDLIAIVTINGQEVDRFSLSDDNTHVEKTYYPGKDQYNIVEIDGGKIRVKEDNSPDQIAVRTGWISKAGQTSICLPHKLVLEVKSQKATSEDDLIITY